MKNLVIFLSLTMSLLLSQGITGSKHDFSTKGWNPGGEICQVCHAPHNTNTSVTDAPLWNHVVTSTVFSPYSTATLDASVGQPNGASKLCLSCHDGTVALDNFGGTTTGTTFIGGGKNLGLDLSNDHPVSFLYDATLVAADGGLVDPTTGTSGLGGTIDSDLLIGNKLECSSCHDVHDTDGNSKLLVIPNTASALCLTCHAK